jgi:hypothetical protein
MAKSLLIVGAGRLGKKLGVLWPGEVIAETLTERSHPQLKSLGFFPRLRSSEGSFDSVFFAVPPSQAVESYEAEVSRALSLWNRTGSFLMVSSTAVYAEENGGIVTERSAEATTSRAETLLKAERRVLAAKGSVVRLAGLYDENSGPHLFYRNHPVTSLRGDGLINLIHYEDAAALCFKILSGDFRSEIFMGCDNSPVFRRQLCSQVGTEGTIGKRGNNDETRKRLDWTPRFRNFDEFLVSQKATSKT